MRKLLLGLTVCTMLTSTVFAQEGIVCGGVLFNPNESANQCCSRISKEGKAIIEAFGGTQKDYYDACIKEIYPDALKAYKAGKCDKATVTTYTRNGVKCKKVVTASSRSETCDDGSGRSEANIEFSSKFEGKFEGKF